MPRKVIPARLVMLCGLTSFLQMPATIAAPPQVTATNPLGVQRGVATELTISGQNLGGNPRIVAPFGFQVATNPPPGADAGNAKFAITVDSSTAIGIYPIRVVTDDGASNPFLFSVGQLPQIAEKEDNGVADLAQAVTTPVVVEGQAAGNDVDFYRFTAHRGERFVIDAQCARIGSGVDPTIRLTKSDRTFVASAEDSPGLFTDARLIATIPDDGEYLVEISDARYQGGGRPVYRLILGVVPVVEEAYPLSGRRGETIGIELRGGTVGSAEAFHPVAASLKSAFGFPIDFVRARTDGPFDYESVPHLIVEPMVDVRESTDGESSPIRGALPIVFQGRIDPPGDEDRFKVVLTPAQRKVRIEVDAAESGSALDGTLQILNDKGEAIAQADDTPLPEGGKKGRAAGLVSPDPSIVLDVPAGLNEITLALRDLAGRGGIGFPYRIKVESALADFEVTLNEPQVSIPKGGTASIGVAITRRGWNGPIKVDVPKLPAGLTCRPATISDGQLVGSVSVTSAPGSDFAPRQLDVVATAQTPDGLLTDFGAKTIVFAQQGNVPTNALPQVGAFAAQGLELPIAIEAPSGPIEIPHGYNASIPLKLSRKAGADGSLGFSIGAPPLGLTVAGSNLSDKALEGTATINVTTDHPLGFVSVGLVGKGKIGAVELTIAVPSVTLNVVRPVAIEPAAAAFEIKPGQTIELKGKLVRKPGFAEPVVVKLDGLPAGLKSEAFTVAPDQVEYLLKVVAEEKAAAVTANPKIVLGFQVAKKDYPFPPTGFSLKVLPPG